MTNTFHLKNHFITYFSVLGERRNKGGKNTAAGLWLHSFVFCGPSLKMKCSKDFRVSLYSVQVHKRWFRQGSSPDPCFKQARQRKEVPQAPAKLAKYGFEL